MEDDYVNKLDSSNALVLEPRRKKLKTDADSEFRVDGRGRLVRKKVKNVLSKKKQKRIEKLKERKQKKAKRSDVLTELSKHQISSEEMVQLTSFAHLNKRPKAEKTPRTELPEDEDVDEIGEEMEHLSSQQSDSGVEEDSENEMSEVDATEDSADSTTVKLLNHKERTQKSASPQPEPVFMERLPRKEKEALEKAVFVPVHRTEEIQAGRMKLPILGEEQIIVEAIKENSVVVICGETGSGKTTQVPQFLYEAGMTESGKMIGITEPRRVAAISMSKRVGEEMNLGPQIVSYQIRYEGNATDQTRIKYMTDGVLLKELQKDIQLSRYSAIIIDEAHERSVYTDILIGLLSRIAPMRQSRGDPLKLIIMSATLRIQDFTGPQLFKIEPKILQVEARQFPVETRFNKRTQDDYLKAAFVKISKIHETLPDGGILVFLSGQREVQSLMSWLRKKYPMKSNESSVLDSANNDNAELRKRTKRKKNRKGKSAVPEFSLDSYSTKPSDPSTSESAGLDMEESGVGEDAALEDSENEEEGEERLNFDTDCTTPLYCLPMFSLLSSQKQARVFEPPPPSARLCVLATNVAETSLTIPNVKYVVDTGKEKVKLYDPVTGVSQFSIQWTSKASAEQRAGRAGRTGPGYCYRLYSSAVFHHDFPEFSTPDIANKPVDELVLMMKAMSIVRVENFPFPSPPQKDALTAAEEKLVKLGALEMRKRQPSSGEDGASTSEARISSLGKTIAAFPVRPHFGKLLALSNQQGLLEYAIALVAVLSVREPLINLSSLTDTDHIIRLVQLRRKWAGAGHSFLLGDLAVLLKAVGASEFEGCSLSFCEDNGLRQKGMIEARRLRRQLTNIISGFCPHVTLNPALEPPSDDQMKFLRQVVLSGMADSVAKRMESSDDAAWVKGGYQTMTLEEPVFIDPSSVLFKHQPEWVVYQDIVGGDSGKKYMRTIAAVEKEWLPIFAPNYCRFENPNYDHERPYYDEARDSLRVKVKATFGPRAWPMGLVEINHPEDLNLYRWFGSAFLNGEVVPKAREFKDKLLAAPSVITKSWAKAHAQSEALLKALVREDICSRKRLEEVWTVKPKYLWEEYSAWLPKSLRKSAESVWPFL